MLTPDQIAASNTEHAHQAAIFQWVSTIGSKQHPGLSLLFAIPNGADYGGNKVTGARMRAEGLKSGVPDMFLPVPAFNQRMIMPGLWVELKRPGLQGTKNGGRSDEQVRWHKNLIAQGWPVVTAYGWPAACRTLLLYTRGQFSMDGAEPGDHKKMFIGCPELYELPEEQW